MDSNDNKICDTDEDLKADTIKQPQEGVSVTSKSWYSFDDIKDTIKSATSVSTFTPEQDGMIIHYVGEISKNKLIVVDILDKPLATEDEFVRYLDEQKTYFRKEPRAEREKYEGKLNGSRYYFEDAGYFYYDSHQEDSYTLFDNVGDTGEEGILETTYAQIKIYDILAKNTKGNDMQHISEGKIYFAYRQSMLCKPNVVVNIYNNMYDYPVESGSKSYKFKKDYDIPNINNQIETNSEVIMPKMKALIEECS